MDPLAGSLLSLNPKPSLISLSLSGCGSSCMFSLSLSLCTQIFVSWVT
jgi:hypothetical protein